MIKITAQDRSISRNPGISHLLRVYIKVPYWNDRTFWENFSMKRDNYHHQCDWFKKICFSFLDVNKVSWRCIKDYYLSFLQGLSVLWTGDTVARFWVKNLISLRLLWENSKHLNCFCSILPPLVIKPNYNIDWQHGSTPIKITLLILSHKQVLRIYVLNTFTPE